MVGQRRFYFQSLAERDYTLETATPVSLTLFGTTIKETSWHHLIPAFCDFLFGLFPEKKKLAPYIGFTWTKLPAWSATKRTVNWVRLQNGLFVNAGLTAVHSVWFLQDALDFFEIPRDKAELIIYRPPYAEPTEIRIRFHRENSEKFVSFMMMVTGMSKEKAIEQVRIVENVLTPILRESGKAYDDFFLFSNYLAFSNYFLKVDRTLAALEMSPYENTKRIVESRACLAYLKEFYKALFA